MAADNAGVTEVEQQAVPYPSQLMAIASPVPIEALPPVPSFV